MATKIRLARYGRKRYAYYHVVVADSRAPRDGRFIERIGSFNPNSDPATVDINFERALYWVMTGAQPTDTVRGLLSNEGVLYMKHLLGGVKKGAFDEAEAERRFNEWKKQDEAKTAAYIATKGDKAKAAFASKLAAEAKVKEARAAAIAAKNAPAPVVEEEAAPEAEETATEETAAE